MVRQGKKVLHNRISMRNYPFQTRIMPTKHETESKIKYKNLIFIFWQRRPKERAQRIRLVQKILFPNKNNVS